MEKSKSYKIYMDYLLEVNSHTNLTAITDPSEIEIKHFKRFANCLRLYKRRR